MVVYIAKIPLSEAQTKLTSLHQHIDREYPALRKRSYLYVALTSKVSGLTYVKRIVGLTKKTTPQTYAQKVKALLPSKLVSEFRSSYEVVGTIAIIEVEVPLRAYEKKMGEALLATNSAIKTVLRKDGPHQGAYRTQPMKFLAGKDTRVTTHVELGVRILVDVEEVYFSARLSSERARISSQIKPGESILCLFSGCAPYPLVFAKKSEAKRIVGVELNPRAHELGLESVKLNRCKNVELVCKDARLYLKSCTTVFDRICLTLPKEAHAYLADTVRCTKKGTIIHYYDFAQEEVYEPVYERIARAMGKTSYKILGTHTCGCQGVRLYRVCVDILIC